MDLKQELCLNWVCKRERRKVCPGTKDNRWAGSDGILQFLGCSHTIKLGFKGSCHLRPLNALVQLDNNPASLHLSPGDVRNPGTAVACWRFLDSKGDYHLS